MRSNHEELVPDGLALKGLHLRCRGRTVWWFIGHGSLDGNCGRLQGEPRDLASQKLTGGLIGKARRAPLQLLILESCNLGKGHNDEAWTKVARRVYANDDFSYPRASD